jgi:hypothetical protein
MPDGSSECEIARISYAPLRAYIDEITERVLADLLHGDSSEAQEVAAPPQLAAGSHARED